MTVEPNMRFRVSQSRDNFCPEIASRKNHGRKILRRLGPRLSSPSGHATGGEDLAELSVKPQLDFMGRARLYNPCYHRCRSATGALRSAKRTSDTNLPEVRRPSAYAHRKLLFLWNSRRIGGVLATHRYECVFIQIDRRNSLAERGHPPPGGLPGAQTAAAARGASAGASLPAAEGKPGTGARARASAPPSHCESGSPKDGAP